MTQSIISIVELRELARQHAIEIVAARAKNDAGETRHRELLQEFKRTQQPLLSDKQFTALYQTYTNLLTTSITNHYFPGQAIEKAPIRVSDIKDGEEIYRANALPLNPVQWQDYLQELVSMATRFAHEIAELAASGRDTKGRLAEQQIAAAKFGLDHGLTEHEHSADAIIYKEAFTKAIEQELEIRTRSR